MPLYELECTSCEYRFEEIQGYNDSAQCPQCGALAKRLISVVNHSFGWTFSEASHERFGKDEVVRNI